MSTAGQMSANMSESVGPDPVWLSKELLLKTIMEQCGITTEELRDYSLVKNKLRDLKIEKVVN